MIDLKSPVSGREFARMTGQTEGAVRKAIGRQSILRGIDSNGKIIPEIASKEWGKPILKSYLEGINTVEKIAKPVKEKPVKIPKPKPVKIVKPKPIKIVIPAPVKKIPEPVKKTYIPKPEKKEAETFDEVVKEIMGVPIPKISKEDLDNYDLSNEFAAELSDHDDKSEAERRLSITKARILQLSYDEKKGLLIDRSKISKSAFGVGQIIRVSFEGLTNIVLDRVRAAPSRNEAKRIMDEEIHAVLLETTKTLSRL